MQYSKIFSVVALLVASAAAAPLCAPNAPNTPNVPNTPHVPGGDHGTDGLPTPSHDLEGKTCSNTQYSSMACNVDGKFSFVSGIADCIAAGNIITTVKCCQAKNEQEVNQAGLINVAVPVNVQCLQIV